MLNFKLIPQKAGKLDWTPPSPAVPPPPPTYLPGQEDGDNRTHSLT